MDNESKEEKFARLAESRVNRAIKDIRSIERDPVIRTYHTMVADAMGLGSDGDPNGGQDVAMRLFLLGFLLLIVLKSVWSFYLALSPSN